MTKYSVYGVEQDWIKDFKTLKEAKEFIKEMKKFDKEQGIEDTYFVEMEEE